MKIQRFLLPCLQLCTAAAVLTDEQHADALVTWLRAENGIFSNKLEMRREDLTDPQSRFGMYAKEGFKEGELLIEVPPILILEGEEKEEDTVMECTLIRLLAQELRLKDESQYAPYVNYLLDTQPPGQLPSGWSVEGKELLERSLGEFPPADPTSWVTYEWHKDCKGSHDPLDEYAALLVVQRSWDDILIPVFDMMSHRNGHWLNTDSNEVHGDDPIRVVATRDIAAGEEIYTSYNMCRDCGNRYTSYGTPEILRDYGFVEQFPQSWIFEDDEVAFRIDEIYGPNGKGTGRYELVEWIEDYEPDEESIESMKKKVSKLEETIELDLAIRDSVVSDYEFDTIVEFIGAMKFALEFAIDAFEGNEKCVQEGTCSVGLERYSNLDHTPPIYPMEDYDAYNSWACESDIQFEIFNNGMMKDIETIESPYQEINYQWIPETRNTCMDLDSTVQICDSYRPHYHEMAVHEPARFLGDIKRVLFVGGGDSMILHETLKYPGLELVVGLELDQRVVRGSYKYFGTQPHFHDDRVEWWFGDASKSLLMLPKDYFGSFDMVLVDLSETVMSFKVTEKLDVLEALTLLVKPDGLFVKNEFYMSTFESMFPYSAQILWYDNPMICSQIMVVGSRSVDFMKTELTDHDVPRFVLRDLDKIDDKFDRFHDYNQNATSIKACDLVREIGDEEATQIQTSSPGILMIVEAEDAELVGSENLKELLTTAIVKAGLTVVSSSTSKNDDGNTLVSIILNEGYMIARAMPESKYVGFDIHLWSSFEKHVGTKEALLSAVGSKMSSSSSFRIIAGGMFGTPAWKQNEKLRGPQQDDICELFEPLNNGEDTNDVKGMKEDNANESSIDLALKESVRLLQGNNQNIGLLCDNDCAASTKFENMDSVEQIVALNCPTMTNFNEFDEEASDALLTCERHLTKTLQELPENGKLDTLVIDPSADKLTTSIMLKVLSSKVLSKKALKPQVKVLSTQASESEKWRIHLSKLFKDKVFFNKKGDFAFTSEVLFSNEKGSFKLVVASDGDEHFITNLKAKLEDLKEATGMDASIQNVAGGMWHYQGEDFVPSRSFSPEDYDQTSPLAQWNSQVPLGHQIVFQMEPKRDENTTKLVLSKTLVRKALELAMLKSSLPLLQKEDIKSIQEYSDAGDGCVLLSLWSGGSISLLWNGKEHVDLNIFVYKGDQVLESLKSFEEKFQENISTLATMLRDEHPRGVGRVISYWDDIKEGVKPHWA